MQVTEESRAKIYVGIVDELETLEELDASVSEELVGGTFIELEDSAELESSAVCDELDTGSTNALESTSEDADERLPTSADESGFADCITGN